MLLNEEGLVFVGKRIDQTVEGWQMPQGGIDGDETPQEAAFRELEEEIGTRNVKYLRDYPDWLCLRPAVASAGHRRCTGRFRGQRQKWIAMRFLGSDSEINVNTAEPEFARMEMAGDRGAAAAHRAVQAGHLHEGDFRLPGSGRPASVVLLSTPLNCRCPAFPATQFLSSRKWVVTHFEFD